MWGDGKVFTAINDFQYGDRPLKSFKKSGPPLETLPWGLQEI